MIFPFLKGFPSFDKAPFTWMLVIVCLVVFLASADTKVNGAALRKISKSENLQLTGSMYKQYLQNKEKLSLFKNYMQIHTQASDQTFGKLALRDYEFLTQVSAYDFTADPVMLKSWKKDIADFMSFMKERPITIFGISAFSSNWKTLITYQFMHGGLLHLLSNMVILLLFGFMIEGLIGGVFFAALFLFSGFVGALFFVGMSGLSGAPMIGASGAISGLIAFYTASESRKNIRYLYFFSPIKTFYGFVYLPTWLIIPVCFAADIASYLATPVEIGGVAYAAHIGGGLFGLLAGAIYKFSWNETILKT